MTEKKNLDVIPGTVNIQVQLEVPVSTALLGLRPRFTPPLVTPIESIPIAVVEKDYWADREGLQVGDEILAINGRLVKDMRTETEFMDSLRWRPLRVVFILKTDKGAVKQVLENSQYRKKLGALASIPVSSNSKERDKEINSIFNALFGASRTRRNSSGVLIGGGATRNALSMYGTIDEKSKLFNAENFMPTGELKARAVASDREVKVEGMKIVSSLAASETEQVNSTHDLPAAVPSREFVEDSETDEAQSSFAEEVVEVRPESQESKADSQGSKPDSEGAASSEMRSSDSTSASRLLKIKVLKGLNLPASAGALYLDSYWQPFSPQLLVALKLVSGTSGLESSSEPGKSGSRDQPVKSKSFSPSELLAKPELAGCVASQMCDSTGNWNYEATLDLDAALVAHRALNNLGTESTRHSSSEELGSMILLGLLQDYRYLTSNVTMGVFAIRLADLPKKNKGVFAVPVTPANPCFKLTGTMIYMKVLENSLSDPSLKVPEMNHKPEMTNRSFPGTSRTQSGDGMKENIRSAARRKSLRSPTPSLELSSIGASVDPAQIASASTLQSRKSLATPTRTITSSSGVLVPEAFANDPWNKSWTAEMARISQRSESKENNRLREEASSA